MRFIYALLAILISAPAFAQVTSRPTDPPVVTAENESWYRLREPVVLGGEPYYPAGAVVFFNGNHMVRTGHYNGIPLYADTTVEPYSIILVPIGRGLMQPYERVRGGELAGTSGSRAPSFPGRSDRPLVDIPNAPGGPTNASQPIGAISVYTPEPGSVATTGPSIEVPSTSTLGTAAVPLVVPPSAPRRPISRESVWIQYMGRRWVSIGPSEPAERLDLTQVGEYAGFPVYANKADRQDDVIYVPMTGGLVAPFKAKN